MFCNITIINNYFRVFEFLSKFQKLLYINLINIMMFYYIKKREGEIANNEKYVLLFHMLFIII